MSRSRVRGWWKRAAAAVLLWAQPECPQEAAQAMEPNPMTWSSPTGEWMDPESGLDAVRNVGIRSGKSRDFDRSS